MRGRKRLSGLLGSLSLLGWLGLVGLCVFVPQAQAFIVINEILADPPAGLLGDANADGAGSTTQDEFVEFFNPTADTIEKVKVPGTFRGDRLNGKVRMPDGKGSKESVAL